MKAGSTVRVANICGPTSDGITEAVGAYENPKWGELIGREGLADVYQAAAQLGVNVELVGYAVAAVADGGVILAAEYLAYGGETKLGLLAE